MAIRRLGPKSQQKTLLTQSLIDQIVGLATELASGELILLTLLNWEYLLRVQSEGIPMEFGTQAEVFELAPQRHSALTMVSGFLLLKLTRRSIGPRAPS